MFNSQNYNAYLAILNEELVVAQGCTEPIAVAFGVAMAVKYLPSFPTKIIIQASGNILKNSKSVVVPNTNNLKGMQAAALAGAIGGNSNYELEVLKDLSPAHIKEINQLMNSGLVVIQELDTPTTLHMVITASTQDHCSMVEIKDHHLQVVKLLVDGVDKTCELANSKSSFCTDENQQNRITDRSILSVDQILDFIEYANPNHYTPLLEQQIRCNTAIAQEGLQNNYGVNVGKLLLKYDPSLPNVVKAYTAAGSDARMSGSTLPVVTNSGSGNQGMTCSTSIVTYAREKNYPHNAMLKALLLSNLVTIHIKTGITRLSCYCGAIVASSGAAAGFAYLEGLDRDQIKMAIINVLGNASGVVCDGAKESCPSKIATGIDAAFQALYLAKERQVFSHGCGIVENCVEATIANIGRLGREGMKETDKVVLNIMTHIHN